MFRAAMTDYNTGTGFWLGHDGSTPKFSIGSTSNYLTWDGSSLTVAGAGQSGTFNAAVTDNNGTVPCKWIKTLDSVVLIINTNSSNNTRASATASFQITNLPASITPVTNQKVSAFGLYSSFHSLSLVAGTALIQSTSVIDFKLLQSFDTANNGAVLEIDFVASGTKGFGPGVTLAYTLG
jgi:hypothetical protein